MIHLQQWHRTFLINTQRVRNIVGHNKEHETRHKEIYFWESTVVMVSYLVHCDTLLQNARYYYKLQKPFYYKMRQKFITKYFRFFITKCDSQANLKKWFVSCPRMAKTLCTRPRLVKKIFITEFWQFLELALFLNVYDTLYWFFIQTFYTA